MAQRCVEFVRTVGDWRSNRQQHVIITLDDGETMADALECLKATRNDWWDFTSIGNEREVERAKNEITSREAAVVRADRVWDSPVQKTDPTPAKYQPVKGQGPRPYFEISDVEPDIPHNYGTGMGEGLDYLDPETRHRIYEAIACEDHAIDDTMFGEMGFDPEKLPGFIPYRIRKRRHVDG